MKILNLESFPATDSEQTRFEAARKLAFSVAESDPEMLEPELVGWIDRATNNTSPVLAGCSGINGWHDYGISHGGKLEVRIGNAASFIFAESSQFDSYAHFGHGPYVNLRDPSGNEIMCRIGGVHCVPLDDWTSKLT
ncbi:MAG: AF1514 family protein [Gallionella sp.]